MSDEQRLWTAATLCKLWDRDPIDRIRAGDGATTLHGRRLSVHLWLQPEPAARLFGAKDLRAQGFLNRFLVAAPPGRMGSRPFVEPGHGQDPRLVRFDRVVTDLLTRPWPLADCRNVLNPRAIAFAGPARRAWITFYNTNERALVAGGPYESLAGFGARLSEHMARLAAILTIAADPDAAHVAPDAVDHAAALASWYAGEAVRLAGAAPVTADLADARDGLAWIAGQGLAAVAVRPLAQRIIPKRLRSARTIRRVMQVLEEHGRIRRAPEPRAVFGEKYAESWDLIAAEVAS